MSTNRLRLENKPDQLYTFKYKFTPSDGILNVKNEEIKERTVTNAGSDSIIQKNISSYIDDSAGSSVIHQTSGLPRIKRDTDRSITRLRYPNGSQNGQDFIKKTFIADGSTAVENASDVSDRNSIQQNIHQYSKDRYKYNKERSTLSKWNFLELRKQDAFYTVDKQTIKSLKEDPVLLEKVIRNNREAEINHFVNMVKRKAERDEAGNSNLSRVNNMEEFENFLFEGENKVKESIQNLKVASCYSSVNRHTQEVKISRPITLKDNIETFSRISIC